MKNKKIGFISALSLTALAGLIAILSPQNVIKGVASNMPIDWMITSTFASKWIKIRRDTSGTDGVCFEGITCAFNDYYNSQAETSYYSPVTASTNYKINLDGLRFSFGIRNASDGIGNIPGTSNYDFGDYFGFFFNNKNVSFLDRNTGNTTQHNITFTLFCKPYPTATQTRLCMTDGTRADKAGYYEYACMDSVASQFSKPDTTSLHNWSSADSVVFTTNSYTMQDKTYYNAGFSFAMDSYNTDWWKLTISEYSGIPTSLWSQNANYNSKDKSATFYLQKSLLAPFISNGQAYLHVYGCGSTTFGYVYDLYNVNDKDLKEVREFTKYLFMSENNSGQCTKYFASARNKYLSLNDHAKQLFATKAEFTAAYNRYVAWANALGEDPFSNSKNSTTVGNELFATLSNTSSSGIYVIVIVSSIALTFVTAVAVKKKKSKQK